MTKIDPSLYLPKSSTAGANNSQLGKDQFLKILMAQLQNQDPLNPMEDKEFISQMATFSSLEQLMGISKGVEGLLQLQSYTPVVEYSNLIDKKITFNTYDNEGEYTGVADGTVKGVSMSEQGIQLVLTDGKKVPVYDVVEINKVENA
ncbi:flagellar basal-body rod modification protein FlgD [Salirhabdus euzebyi]|uniref:Flagellar basal-body rod modification protein FlgD n=1 Tax=Salirhabdus euzebyi TaxID=394506 RepID=A0A841Q3G3_9BACI|nr:flagellar hook assembly protein FlgD [Salirhabdus euzebyi]MBB6452920.1 flagellar basal-body rod modification protein FlgD [Salirhabdus euzebyi]